MLEQEMKKVEKIAIQFARLTPQVHFKTVKKEKIGDLTRLKIVLENKGFLSTNGSQQAVAVGAVKKPRIKLDLLSHQQLVTGLSEMEIEHLSGRDRYIPVSTPVRVFKTSNSHQCQLEWLIRGRGPLTVAADFERGGLISLDLVI